MVDDAGKTSDGLPRYRKPHLNCPSNVINGESAGIFAAEWVTSSGDFEHPPVGRLGLVPATPYVLAIQGRTTFGGEAGRAPLGQVDLGWVRAQCRLSPGGFNNMRSSGCTRGDPTAPGP